MIESPGFRNTFLNPFHSFIGPNTRGLEPRLVGYRARQQRRVFLHTEAAGKLTQIKMQTLS
jgi:hypothetical protein